ncbi:hypothetical protein [Acinetobacter sp. ANC 4648]|uniref:hypothetical protein n=1 Tax=Acinetobacter sp. ANC 4648 TaxID=1977875 RepID=UPI000A3489FC|nr:hypothetical protein [Acinetobacter sp. ANC 4648]OTG79205.1 hypothetical protein B9T27_14625 [Acinetobacter sp. ANC 4648]
MENSELKPIGSLLSKDNNAYYVDVITDETSESEDLLQSTSNTAHTVSWPVVSGSNTFIDCDSDTVVATHVEKYLLNKDGNLWYTYKLTVKVNKSGDYYFTDASNDTYKLSVSFESSKHSLSYNSDNPTIVSVQYVDY